MCIFEQKTVCIAVTKFRSPVLFGSQHMLALLLTSVFVKTLYSKWLDFSFVAKLSLGAMRKKSWVSFPVIKRRIFGRSAAAYACTLQY